MKALVVRESRFHPPFCPNPECKHHKEPKAEGWWNFLKPYTTKAYGKVDRFYCRDCGKTFSVQTFRLDYYCKKVVDYKQLHHLSSEGISIRGMSRFFCVSPGCILNRIQRLGRQCLALHNLCRGYIWGGEDVAIDGFQSFDVSKYFPNNITLGITADSLFVLEASHGTLRRFGRMSERQLKKREELDNRFSFERGALVRSFREILDYLSDGYPRSPGRPLVILTDEKKEYERSFRNHSLFKEQKEQTRCVHYTVSSKEARTRNNPLFPCNYLDREIRKDQAAHRRKTACPCRNVNNGMLRLWCYLGWHNYWKKYPIRDKRIPDQTHGELAGINSSFLSLLKNYVYETRIFFSRIRLSTCGERAWLSNHRTPLKDKHDYLPSFVTG